MGNFRRLESTLGQCRYMPSCLTKGFPTSAFKLYLLVRDLMWLAENGTLKSSWICLLPIPQDALLAMWRHFDWNICSFLIRVKRQASRWSTHNPSLDRLAAYVAELHFWDHCSWSGEVPALTLSVPLSFSPDWYQWPRSAIYHGSPKDNRRYQPSGLAPRKAELVGIHLPALAKIIAVLSKMMAILQFLSHFFWSPRYNTR